MGSGGWAECKWPLLFHLGEAALFRIRYFGLNFKAIWRGCPGASNPPIPTSVIPFQFLTYHNPRCQPRTQCLSSSRPLSRSMGGKEILGSRLDSSWLVLVFMSGQKKPFPVQNNCHLSFQKRSLSLPASNIQTNEFQERTLRFMSHVFIIPQTI